MNTPVLLYGATGFTGRLLVQRARASGLRPLLAARNARTLERLAAEHDLRWTAVALEETERLHEIVARCAVVLNAAGPFIDTARPLVDACIATGTHYLDITGEISVVEDIANRDAEAADRGIMLMPAVGFDVVPSDCLVAHVVRQLPDATRLRIAVDVPTPLSRGSMKTGLSQLSDGIRVRRSGRLVGIAPGSASRHFDFGDGPRAALPVSLCDVATAFHSTGVPDIEAYCKATVPLWLAMSAMRVLGPAALAPGWRDLLLRPPIWLRDGPGETARESGWATIVVEAVNARGQRAAARLRTPEAYTATADAAVRVTEMVLAGSVCPGFQTPSRVFGPDFVLSLVGVRRENL